MSRLVLALMLTCVACFGCSPAQEATEMSAPAASSADVAMGVMTQKAAEAPMAERGRAMAEEGKAAATPASNMAAVEQSRPDRYLIKNGTMTLEVDDVRVAAQQASAIAVGIEGYTANRQESLSPYGPRSITMQLRVPAKQFDMVMDQLGGLGTVLQQQVQTEEVTEEFVDTDARVRNLKQTEERLLGHLQSSTNLEEILSLERELTRVREEIERMEGRLRFLTSRIDFSTITVTLNEEAKATPVMPAQAWSFRAVGSDAIRSLLGFLQGLLGIAIWLVVWAVVWLPVVLLVWLLVRRLVRPRRPAPAPPLPTQTSPRGE